MMVNKYTLENEHTRTLVLEGGGGDDGKEVPSSNTPVHVRSCGRVVGGGHAGRHPLLSKTSMSARLREWWEVVVMEDNHHR